LEDVRSGGRPYSWRLSVRRPEVPLYTITTQTGALSYDGKSKLAAELTEYIARFLASQRTGYMLFLMSILQATASPPGSPRPLLL
jgi:hypothetical protein